MPDTLIYPENWELFLIDQDYIAEQTLEDDLFDLFPIVTQDAWFIEWEQLDNYLGLQAIRGLNGEPPVVKPTGLKRYSVEPGVYGEFSVIPEDHIAKRRIPGTVNTPINITDLVAERQYHLTHREYVRIKNNLWTLLQLGIFTVYNAHGAKMHQDQYTFQQFTASPSWATLATATPLADLRNAKATWTPGHSVSFGSGARAYLNSVTMNWLLGNQNPNDLFGRRVVNGGATINDLSTVNRVLLDNDLPQLIPYDRGFYNDANAFTRYLANGKVVIVGERPNGQRIGEYRMVRNPANPDMAPGPHLIVTDSLDYGQPSPRQVKIDKGHVGGPVLFYPSAVGVINA